MAASKTRVLYFLRVLIYKRVHRILTNSNPNPIVGSLKVADDQKLSIFPRKFTVPPSDPRDAQIQPNTHWGKNGMLNLFLFDFIIFNFILSSGCTKLNQLHLIKVNV